MKLRYSSTSPYVRKVSIVAIELGLADQIENVGTDPWDPESDLSEDNPLGRVPALVLDTGECLYDSVVICEYLDSLSDTQTLFPAGAERWRILRQHALMNGILDAGINALVERIKRPESLRWEEWATFQLTAVRRALAAIVDEVWEFEGQPPNIAQITAGAALGYLDFRYADEVDWRGDHPALADWYAKFSRRESMQATVPRMP